MTAPEECSQCGEAIPKGALACPGCGADEKTGWDTNPYQDEAQVDIPDYLTEDYDPSVDGDLGLESVGLEEGLTPDQRAFRIVGTLLVCVLILYVGWVLSR